MNFIPLHVYSGYSILRSGLTIEKIVSSARKFGYEGVGITDYETLSGFPSAYHEFKKYGIKPVFGIDVTIDETLLTLIIQSEEGYRNAMAIDLLASQKKLNRLFLLDHQEGLTIVLPTEYSPLHTLYKSDQAELVKWLRYMSEGFKSFYLGIPYLPDEPEFPRFLRALVTKYPYETVAFPHILYRKEEDAIAIEILRAVAEDRRLDYKEKKGPNHFLDEETIHSYFSDREIGMTKAIAERSTFEFIKKRGGLLHYPNDLGLTSEDYLFKLAKEGLERKNPGYDEEYKKRLEYELSVINKMGYADYFLIVSDYVNWAKTHGVSVGPGRGSGAGSLVAYALDIVTPDPIKYDLLFERFLNPERQSMPDIDVDFADVTREKVVDYIKTRYGKEHASHIVTMQTMGAKQSLRDVGRVYNYETREIDMISKTIRGQASFAESYRKNKQFKDLVDSDKYYLEIIHLAAMIEGLPRQTSLHAAGVVLNDKPLPSAIPVHDGVNGYVAGYEMTYLEEQGFLKMDILGLKNLTIIDDCVARIAENGGPKLNPLALPYEDKEAIQVIAKGRTMGLFQLESSGMRGAIRELQPREFMDVVHLIALYRPGPMENIPTFVRRRNGQEKITYLSPELSRILSSTYGIIVYQEQIMQIVTAMAGFSFGQADLFRRAISKKDAHKLMSLKEDFIKGCLNKGHKRDVAEKVYDLIYRFADYGFNKSHSVSYAIIACQMAYLKAHYPSEFYASVLDNGIGPGDDKFSPLLSEMKESGLHLDLPSINDASTHFLVKKSKILFPISAIKTMQNTFAQAIVTERNNNGRFRDLFDFAKRMKPFGLNLPTLVRLVDAGCFDCLNKNRSSLRASCASALRYAEMFSGESGQAVLFELNIPQPILVDVPNDEGENLEAEKEALGIMISGSPLSLHMDALEGKDYTPLSKAGEKNGPLKTAGAIKSIRTITAKNGKTMAFVGIYDDVGELELTVFSDQYDASYPLLKKDNVVYFSCHKDNRRENTYILDEMEAL